MSEKSPYSPLEAQPESTQTRAIAQLIHDHWAKHLPDHTLITEAIDSWRKIQSPQLRQQTILSQNQAAAFTRALQALVQIDRRHNLSLTIGHLRHQGSQLLLEKRRPGITPHRANYLFTVFAPNNQKDTAD